MTEIGMGISNPYNGERRAGYIGQPLPGVDVQLFDDKHAPISAEGVAGEIRIRGDNVFLEYWDNPEATAESFRDGWFCTGDVAVIEDGYYRIMGRSSIDIIKSGGYKLSALEIEGVLLTHEDIREVAVIGVEDETWGSRCCRNRYQGRRFSALRGTEKTGATAKCRPTRSPRLSRLSMACPEMLWAK